MGILMKNHFEHLTVLALSLLCAAAHAAKPGADTGWPHVLQTQGSRIEIFQPQVESWQTNTLRARAVVDVTLPYDSQSHLGVAWFSATTQVDNATRLVTLTNLTITKVKFSAIVEQEANLQQLLQSVLPAGATTIALDRLVTASVVAQHRARQANVPVKNDAPVIIWTTNALAALVLIDGEPVLRPVQGSSLMRVINTASLILFDPSGRTYYLYGAGCWFQAESISGPWSVASRPPAAVAALTPPSNSPPAPGTSEIPVVFVSTQPAELLHTVGGPAYKTENGSGLMYVANSDSQLFYNSMGGTLYLLLSGRWFSAGSLTGPWAYVPAGSLPSAFSQIDPGGPKGTVLCSVPGTAQAAAARVGISIPQTGTIQRSGASFQVELDGPPQLKPIDGTALQYVVNASSPVLLCQRQYYAVGNAVWFVSSSVNGPWAVATSVPQDIYTIPPSSPLYYVTFLYIAYADGDQVEFAYTPGYTGSYDPGDDSGPFYGTGWYYAPWVGNYYYGWGWPYGYAYQYRWWDQSWLWRPAWNRVGNLYAVNRANLYDTWPRAAASAAYVARVTADRALGDGYPSTYGRFAGAFRAVPMAIPASASLADPCATIPRQQYRSSEARGAEQMMRSIKVGSAASRDLYAGSDGQIYRRQQGQWYRADAGGEWNYVAPAVGPRTSAYHPETVAAPYRPAAYRGPSVPAAPSAIAAPRDLDEDYYARASAERSYQSYRSYGYPARRR
jgi:hypothetical protein